MKSIIQQLHNNVTCGDCIDVMRGMPWASVDFILTDPPYLVGPNSPRPLRPPGGE